MKLASLFIAGALAAGTMVATTAPAAAQRYGYDHGRGYDRDRGYDRGYGDRHYRPRHGYYGPRGHYRPYNGYGRSRVVCRVHRGRYGPVRDCFRTFR